MKLLLTSGGITNKKIADALLDLVGKSASETNLAFIPTAANVEGHDKGWFIDNLYQLKQQKFKMIDIVDVSALPRWNWEERLRFADVLFFSGGVTPHLMYWVEKSGLKELLPELSKTRVYVGVSAGSIIMSPTLSFSNQERAKWYKEKFGYEAKEGLGFIDFYIRPHLNSPTSPHSRKELIEKTAKEIPQIVYAIDDQVAIKVVDGKIKINGCRTRFILKHLYLNFLVLQYSHGTRDLGSKTANFLCSYSCFIFFGLWIFDSLS